MNPLKNNSRATGFDIPPNHRFRLTLDQMLRIFPIGNKDVLQSTTNCLNKYRTPFGLNYKLPLKHFLAQAGVETGGFKKYTVTENLSYTIKNINTVFPKYFSTTSGRNPADYARSPETLANLVYGNRMGNGPESSGDGWKYRGRGVLQLTGKDNYAAFTQFYQKQFQSTLDFVSSPDNISSDAELAVMSGLWYFKVRVIDSKALRVAGGFADTDASVKQVSMLVNGGTNGLAERQALYKKILAVLG
jgi:putative chitinase